jgi:hypothetical protein
MYSQKVFFLTVVAFIYNIKDSRRRHRHTDIVHFSEVFKFEFLKSYASAIKMLLS